MFPCWQRCSYVLLLMHVLIGTPTGSQSTSSVQVGPPHGALLLDGGPDASPEVARRFVELAGGANAKIVLIPTASGDDAARDPATLQHYRQLFGVGCCNVLHTTRRAAADRAGFAACLQNATGVWITGGSPAAITEAYWHTAVQDAIRAVLDRGGVVGGSSAGALILGSRVPTDHPEHGLSFLRHTIVMPHLNRNNARKMLVDEVAGTPGMIGIGVSENTAAVIRGNSLEVLGIGEVVVVDGRSHGQDQFAVLRAGNQFHLLGLK